MKSEKSYQIIIIVCFCLGAITATVCHETKSLLPTSFQDMYEGISVIIAFSFLGISFLGSLLRILATREFEKMVSK